MKDHSTGRYHVEGIPYKTITERLAFDPALLLRHAIKRNGNAAYLDLGTGHDPVFLRALAAEFEREVRNRQLVLHGLHHEADFETFKRRHQNLPIVWHKGLFPYALRDLPKDIDVVHDHFGPVYHTLEDWYLPRSLGPGMGLRRREPTDRILLKEPTDVPPLFEQIEHMRQHVLKPGGLWAFHVNNEFLDTPLIWKLEKHPQIRKANRFTVEAPSGLPTWHTAYHLRRPHRK